MRAWRLELRTAAIAVIALTGALAGAYAVHEDRSDDDRIWLLPYESGR